MVKIAIEWYSQNYESHDIIEFLKSPDILVINNQVMVLSRGILKFLYLIDTNEDNIEKINQLINKFTYQPLILEFDTTSIEIEKLRYFRKGIRRILEEDFKNNHRLDISDVEVIEVENKLSARPVDRNGYPIYLNKIDMELFNMEDYIKILGYDLVSSDPAVWYYLKTDYEIDGAGKSKDWHVTEWHNIAIMPIFLPKIERSNQIAEVFITPDEIEDEISSVGIWSRESNMFKIETNRFVSSLHIEQIYAININEFPDSLLKSFTKLWELDIIDIVKTPQQNRYAIIKFHDDLQLWIRKALIEIKTNNLPFYYLSGKWTQYTEPTLENIAKLTYALKRSYQDIARGENWILLQYLEDAKILPNLVLSARFSSWREVLMIKDLFENYLLSSRNWQVMTFSDIGLANIRKNQVLTKNRQLHPLVFSIPSDDLFYLIIDDLEAGNFKEVEIVLESNGEDNYGKIILEGNFIYEYVPSIKPLYKFYIENIYLMTYSTSNPSEIVEKLDKLREELLTPFGKSFLLRNQDVDIDRSFIISEKDIQELLN